MHPEIEDIIADTKTFRRDIDGLIQRLKNVTTLDPSVTGSDGQPAKPMGYRASSERSLALTKLQEAVMWLGMDLKDIGETPNPYPHSYDSASPVIEPTADGLKL